MSKKSNKKKYLKILLKFGIKWGFIALIWLSIIFSIMLMYYSKDLPDIIQTEQEGNSIVLLYSNDEELNTYGNSNNDMQNYAEFPLHLIDGLVATEDRKFFRHHGFDYLGMLRALIVNIRYGSIRQGGSTITQQLSKMILKNSKKTFKRKIQELLLAIQLEKKFSKEEIITLYLNKAYFGAGKYGIKDASKFYFNKNVYDLELEESAMLIGLLKAPTKYSPQNNPELSKERTKQIITNMYNAKLLSKENYEKYLKYYSAAIMDAAINSTQVLNEHLYFSDWVRNQIPEYTKDTNLEIKTTLNEKVQNIIERNIYDFSIKYKDKLKTSQIAVVVLSSDGAILGMTGGIDYNKSEFNRAIYAYRQPGSLFKLFVFLTGIREKHYTPESTFIDEPVAVGNWFPENYNNKYYGKVNMRTAFAKSLNSVAIQIAKYSGLANVANMAKKMGIISSIDKNDPTIVLGTTQTNLLEITSAYSVIPNNGYITVPHSILKIRNKNTNNIIYNRKVDNKIKILSEEEVRYMKQMMHEVLETGTGQNARINSLASKGYEYIGGKTGTSQNYSDAWFVGYINDIAIGIWIGNDNNNSMNKTTGGSLPSILWKLIASDILRQNQY